MRWLVIGLLIVCLSAFAVPVAAQNASENASVAQNDTDQSGYRWIDNSTAIVDADLVDDTAEVTFYSEENQYVTLTDAGWTKDGSGDVNTERKILREGESSVSFEVTKHRGEAAFTVDTGDVLHGELLESSSQFLGTNYHWMTVLTAAAVGAVAGVGVLTALIDYVSNKLMKREDVR